MLIISQDLLWREYDPALKQLIPNRQLLSRPHPGFAIGLDTRLGLSISSPFDFNEMTEDYKFHSIPAVDLFVYPSNLAFPFFICETKSDHGSRWTAENQMANAMVMAHDILCSLNAQDDLYVLGLVQIADMLSSYISFSTRFIDEDGKPYTRDVSLL